MYNTGAPQAVGNAGYAEGGLEDGSNTNNIMINRDWSNFNPWAETSQQTEQSVRVVTLYGPSGQVATVTLPAQQAQYDELLTLGYSETPVAVTTETAVSKDNGGGGGGTVAQAKAGKPYREMTPDELKKAYEDNQKASSIMKGMALINPVIGLAGMGATKFAEKQIIEAMKEKKVDLPEEKDFFDTIVTPIKSFFGLDKEDTTQAGIDYAAKGDDRDTSWQGGKVFENQSKPESDDNDSPEQAAAKSQAKAEAAAKKLGVPLATGGKAEGGLMQKKK